MVCLDYAATEPLSRFCSANHNQYLNPNAAYALKERRLLERCEEAIKGAIGVNGGHVLYFRCATEAIKWLYNETNKRDGMWAHSPYEHDACLFGVEGMPYGIPLSTVYYIHQWVNHITGEIFDLKSVKDQLSNGCHLVVDATAGFGKAELPRDLDDIADALFMSGHKIGCPELSFMWLSDDLCEWLGATKDIRNQWGLHHGSLSVASVMALTDAAEWACDEERLVACQNEWLNLYWTMTEKFHDNSLHGFSINATVSGDRSNAGQPSSSTPAINAIRLNGINADALQQFLATKGIYVGIGGSACSDSKDFRVLRSCGLNDDEAAQVIRVSFGPETTVNDIDSLVGAIVEYKNLFTTGNSSCKSGGDAE